MSRRRPRPLPSALALLALALSPAVPRAQPATAPAPAKPAPRPWKWNAQANGSLLFGNAEQRIVGGRTAVSRADSVMALDVSLQMLYGDATQEDGPRRVTKRLWLGATSLEFQPAGQVSPFLTATIESNLEKRIATRTSLGTGAKHTFVRSRRNEASLSAALLDERTVALAAPGAAEDADPTFTRVTRWSARARVQHGLDQRLKVTHVTSWRPRVRTTGDFVVLSTSEARYALTRALNVSTSLLVNHDSEATSRGARVNTDGQLLLGVGATW